MPADLIERLLRERPKVVGLAVAGAVSGWLTGDEGSRGASRGRPPGSRVRPEREDASIRDPVTPPGSSRRFPPGGSPGLPRLPQLPQSPMKGKLTVLPSGPEACAGPGAGRDGDRPRVRHDRSGSPDGRGLARVVGGQRLTGYCAAAVWRFHADKDQSDTWPGTRAPRLTPPPRPPPCPPVTSPARWTRRSASGPGLPEVRHGARARRRSPLRRRGPSRPARCIPRSCATGRAAARSAAWRSSRGSSRSTRRRIPSCAT